METKRQRHSFTKENLVKPGLKNGKWNISNFRSSFMKILGASLSPLETLVQARSVALPAAESP